MVKGPNIQKSDKSMLKQLTKNILYFPYGENDRPTLATISGSEHTLLVDAGNSPNHAKLFLSYISKYSLPPIKWVFLTHWHWDHSFGLGAMNLASISHKKTLEELKGLVQLEWNDDAINERVQDGTEIEFVRDMIRQEYPNQQRKISIALPELVFLDEIEIGLGETHCHIKHLGGDHSPDSSILFIPEEKVLFLGDCLCPNLHRNKEYTCKNVFSLINNLLKYDANLYVESHDIVMTRNQFKIKCQQLQRVGTLVGKYKNQNAEIIDKLKNEARKDGISIDKTWLEDMNDIINAFQVGLKLVE